MAANTLTRDQILLQALQLADVPSLNVLDVSNGNPVTGTINASATSISWLQNGINYFYSCFPWASTATTATGNLTASSPALALPPDFILDLKDGLILTVGTTQRRLKRRGLQVLISMSMNAQSHVPHSYCVQGASLRMAPTPNSNYAYTLWYWQRPAALSGSSVPAFPSDLVLVEYVRIKAMEWIRAAPPGSALAYANKVIAELRKSGLGHESEYDTIPLDPEVFVPGAGDRSVTHWSWMGDVGA